MMTDNFKKHTVDTSAKQLKFLQRFLINRFLDQVVAILKPLSIQSVLDVGAGEGFTLARLEKEGIGTTREGIDPLDSALALGKKYNPTIKLVKGSIYELPYKDKSFDVVVCTEVLEHLEHPEAAVKELFRVSRKYILVSVPHEPWFMLGNFLRGKNVSRWGNDIEHINHWTASGFVRFLKSYGTEHMYTAWYPLPWTVVLIEKN